MYARVHTLSTTSTHYKSSRAVMDTSEFSKSIYSMNSRATINATIACDATFDSSGHLLIAEGSDDKIHNVDAATGGKALKTIFRKGHQWCLTSYTDTIMVCTTFPDQLLSITYLE